MPVDFPTEGSCCRVGADQRTADLVYAAKDHGRGYKSIWHELQNLGYPYSRAEVQAHCKHIHWVIETPVEPLELPEPFRYLGSDPVPRSTGRLRTHLFIPDTQVKPGVPMDHLGWIGNYAVDKFADDDLAIVHGGDHWDLPSLSSYDRGKRQMEGRRYVRDIKAGNEGFALLNEPLETMNARRQANHERQWWPERHLLRGNHENRAVKAIENDAQLDGLISDSDFESPGWTVHPFLQILDLDGVWYSHYFYQPMTGNPFTGTIENRLRQIGHTFTMGHQQTLLYGVRYVGNKSQHGLVAGSCYLHDEDYKGPQGNAHWRGIIVCHEVDQGSYDPMFVSLDYLCRKYEGVSLDRFMTRKYSVGFAA